MNGNKKAIMKFRIKLQQFGLAIFFFGMALFVNKIPGGKMITVIGGMLYASSRVIRAFEPIYHEPHWELVYPELAKGSSDDLIINLEKNEDHEK